jgi:hypothetical protein
MRGYSYVKRVSLGCKCFVGKQEKRKRQKRVDESTYLYFFFFEGGASGKSRHAHARVYLITRHTGWLTQFCIIFTKFYCISSAFFVI